MTDPTAKPADARIPPELRTQAAMFNKVRELEARAEAAEADAAALKTKIDEAIRWLEDGDSPTALILLRGR